MAFATGMNALQEALSQAEQRAEAVKSGGSGKSLTYLNWKPGDRKVLRFLTDDIITADFYSFVVDKTGQTKNFMVDPADPHRLQRYMSPVPGVGWRKNYQTGVLEEPITQKQSVNIAVLREEVPGPDGKMVIEDVLSDRMVDGTAYPSRTFGIVQQSVTTFWHTLSLCYKRFGTICDRDYEITREGSGFNTKYSVIPLPEVPELDSTEKVQQYYFYDGQWDDKDPQRFLKCPQTVSQWADYFSGEDRYKYWLSPEGGAPAPSGRSGLDEFKPGTTHNPADEAQAVASAGTKFSSLRDTLLSNVEQKK